MGGPADSLKQVPVILTPDLDAVRKPFSPEFFSELDADFNGFKGHVLVSDYAFDADWAMWERHPHGDEPIYLLEGAIDFILRKDGQENTIRLDQPGQCCVVPRGWWHTARIAVPSRALFLTPGEGTEHTKDP